LTASTLLESLGGLPGVGGGTNVFSNNEKLKLVKLPASVEELKEQTFANNTELDQILFLSSTAPAYNNGAFEGLPDVGIVWHPVGAEASYNAGTFSGTPLENWFFFPVTYSAPVFANNNAPYDRIILEGGTATFAVETAATPDATYQWQTSVDGGLSWTDIAGADQATLNLTGSTVDDTDSLYRVVADNPTTAFFGSTVSRGAKLTVLPLSEVPGGGGGTTPPIVNPDGTGGGNTVVIVPGQNTGGNTTVNVNNNNTNTPAAADGTAQPIPTAGWDLPPTGDLVSFSAIVLGAGAALSALALARKRRSNGGQA
jgi:hypothetical protein